MIPDDVMERARNIWHDSYGVRSPEAIRMIAQALLAERLKALGECADIARPQGETYTARTIEGRIRRRIAELKDSMKEKG